MTEYMELLAKSMKENADSIAFVSEGKSHGLTYGTLDRNSGKVYSWLKSHGIGREDFVFICLPRGVRTAVAMIGVLKAGAAFVIVESTYAPDRIAFIMKDCGCILTIDEDMFMEMMEAESLDGFEKTDPHDAAYAVYTSGTTGNPKGVIHEYGNLVECYKAGLLEETSFYDTESRFAMTAPLNFVAFLIIVFTTLPYGAAIYIVPYSIAKNSAAMKEFLIDMKISQTFMTASFARTYENTSPYLKNVFISSEPANGVYFEGPAIYNIYAMSETGFETMAFRLDRKYEDAPIGKPPIDLNVYILDEKGNPVTEGEPGELCFDNRYVRGYMNLPEKTAHSFVNGIFHTGDIARKNPDGNFVLLGRKDDMIKINGNRIEPAEIEAAVKDALNLSHVIAKGFDDGRRAYVCLYYLSSEPAAAFVREKTENMNELNETLLKRIPYYMLPTYYVELDEFPRNPNGKISRKMLKDPDAASYRSSYRAPSGELEEKLCAAFEKVLGEEHMGADDDFYLLGGDSIAAMNMLDECCIPGFETGDLFRYRTPAKIARALESKSVCNENPHDEEAKAREKSWKLNRDQIFVADYQFEEPKSTMWNLTQLFRMKQGIDADRLAEAVERAMRNHPAFSTELGFNDDSEMVFIYNPEMFLPPEVVDIMEKELLENRYSLRKPFNKITGVPLYRCMIYRTEKTVYLFTDMWHMITDGTSLAIFREEIARLYENPEAELSEDYFYLTLKRNQLLERSSRWKEAADYYRELDIDGYQHIVDKDHDSNGLALGTYESSIETDEIRLAECGIARTLGRNGFYALCMMLATASISGCRRQIVDCVINGRDDAERAGVFGLLFRTVPVILDFSDIKTLGELEERMKDSMEKARLYSFYPAGFVLYDNVPTTCILYQKGIYEFGTFGNIAEEFMETDAPDAADGPLMVEVVEGESERCCMVNYSADMFSHETVEKLFTAFAKAVNILVECGSRPDTGIEEIMEGIL